MKPDFWDQARAELSQRDPVMARIIAERDPAHHLTTRGDPFQTLARSIVGQQISLKAAQTVWERFARAAGEMAPARVGRMRIATLRNCGLSERKAEYLKELARSFHSGGVDPAAWPSRSDDEIIAELVAIRGIGRWTAEMFLIFNLLRPDILPLDDIGLVRGIERHYRNGEPASRREVQALGEAWRPWRTVATWYMWRSLEPLPVEY